jgi:hypothetical protein
MRQLTLIVGLLLAIVAIGSGWIEEGEVVELTTFDARAHGHETDLWIVEVAGRSYVRADLPGAAWLARLRANPEIELRRNGSKERLRAAPVEDPSLRTAVDDAMAAKYGFANRLLGAIRNDERAVAVLLEPIPAETR